MTESLMLKIKGDNMKKYVLYLFLLTTIYSQEQFSFGMGKNNHGFTLSMVYNFEQPYFVALGGNIFSSVDDAYDFKPGLFDDPELGKVAESVWIAGGYRINAKSAKFLIGGGLAFEQGYYKYRDPSEILGDERGIYYVTDDASSKTRPMFYVGSSIKVGDEESWLQELGVSFVSNLSDFNVTFGIPF